MNSLIKAPVCKTLGTSKASNMYAKAKNLFKDAVLGVLTKQGNVC